MGAVSKAWQWSCWCGVATLGLVTAGFALPPAFHDAPAIAASVANPYHSAADVEAGAKAYEAHCASCHGARGEGSGNVPDLAKGPTQQARDGELFWFITHGAPANGMPPWAGLPAQQRWQIVSYLKQLPTAKPANAVPASEGAAIDTPPPQAPFTDFRYEAPGKVHHIQVSDLPAPYATRSAGNGPQLAPRPDGAMPVAPPGFKVNLYAQGLHNPRVIRIAPNGDVFVAETEAGRIHIFRGMRPDGTPQHESIYITGLNEPYGIAFYPAGNNPQWIYIGDTDAVLRLPYRSGDLTATGKPQKIADLPHGDGHSTRDLAFSADGKTLYAAVGSGSNVNDPDTHKDEFHRADILAMNPDGSDQRVYAYGLRNPAGIAVDPANGQLWATINERDGLGDNLVPDYITHVQQGGFYGWPWWYMGGHQDPRLPGTHPELKDKVITPDIVLQPHNASLQLAFYQADRFPAEYRGDIFAAEHGSWNRSTRAGYEVIRIARHQSGKTDGSYEDFLTGFVLPDGRVWGRPVSVAVASDGSLLVSDDGGNVIWRVDHP